MYGIHKIPQPASAAMLLHQEQRNQEHSGEKGVSAAASRSRRRRLKDEDDFVAERCMWLSAVLQT